MGKGISRRGFLGATGAALAAGAVARRAEAARAQWAIPPELRASKARIGKVYLGRARPGWPKARLDLQAEVKRFEAQLAKLRPQLEDVEFVGGDLVSNNAALARAMKRLEGVDGILAIHLSLGTGPYLTKLLELGVPVVLFSMPYSGHEWHIIASLQRMGKKVEVYPSSRYEDIVAAVRPIRAIHRLRETKILYLRNGGPDPKYTEAVRKKFGVRIKTVKLADLTRAYKAADRDEVEAEFRLWKSGAEKIVEPSDDEIRRSARMSVAIMDMLKAEKAQAITINCLGVGLIQKGLAYPCLGFSRLNSMGLVGMCEADLKSTLTSLIFGYLTGKPGFVTDPVIDISNNTIIHAHCVAAIKMDGPYGEQCPYIIRSHLEDDRGASLYVRMRIGQKITMARMIGTDVMLFSTGEIIDTPYVDRGCRTKITTRVSDAMKIMEGWSCGLHRVVFYGDHGRDIRRLARLLDFKVVEEGVDNPHEVPGLEWNPWVHA